MSESVEDILPYSIGVHVSHCCGRHGCKYGEEETCPVSTGTHAQEYPCEMCPDPQVVAKLLPPGESLREQIGPLQRTLGHCVCGEAIEQEPGKDVIHTESGVVECDLAGSAGLDPEEIETAEFDPHERRSELRGAGAVTSMIEVWEPRGARADVAAREVARLGMEPEMSEVWVAIKDAIEAYDAGARTTVGTYSEARVSAVLAALAANDHLSGFNTRPHW